MMVSDSSPISRNVLLVAGVVAALGLSGCGGGIKGTAMQGIDDAARAAVASALESAGIYQEPQAIKDLGDCWVVALPGGDSISASASDIEASFGDESGGSSGFDNGKIERQSYEKKPAPTVSANAATQVIVTKTGTVQILQ